MRRKAGETFLGKKKREIGILWQVAAFFLIAVLIIGIVTFFMLRVQSIDNVRNQTELLAEETANEVIMSVREYPAHEWFLRYWYRHADELDVEYDTDYSAGTKTEEKLQLVRRHHPELSLKYAEAQELEALPEEDQKLCAEIVYSWIITRVNQIKRAYQVDYLFCVVADEAYQSQCFLFSAADEGAVRGTNYEEVYVLGTSVSIADNQSQQDAMRQALEHSTHLAEAGDYVDYYAYLGDVDTKAAFIGLTFNLSGLLADVQAQTWIGTGNAVILELLLAAFCLLLIYFYVLRPLKHVQQGIRTYKITKDSKEITESLSLIRSRNEIGQLSDDVVNLSKEIDDYLGQISAISAEKQRLGTELSIASQIQEGMLPSIFPAFPERREFDVYATMHTAKEVGGDFYDFFLIDDDHLAIVMADVSGKGVPAALFMMASKILINNFSTIERTSPAQILETVNHHICMNNKAEMFVTAWLGILELSTGRLKAANAGHEYPAIQRRGGPFRLFKDRHGVVLGGLDGMRYQEYEILLKSGDSLFLYTDGVTEAADAAYTLFGTERMLRGLNQAADAAPKEVLETVKREIDAFVGEAPQFDDITMLCLRYLGDTMKKITVDAKIENLQQVQSFIDTELEAAGCSMKAQMQIDIAVEELFVNIANYAYAPGSGSAVIGVDVKEGVAEITFADSGIPYDPLKREDPDVLLSAEDREIGGLGIFMVKKTMDDMFYEYRDGQNLLTIRKKI